MNDKTSQVILNLVRPYIAKKNTIMRIERRTFGCYSPLFSNWTITSRSPPPSRMINFPFSSVLQGSFEIHQGCLLLVRAPLLLYYRLIACSSTHASHLSGRGRPAFFPPLRWSAPRSLGCWPSIPGYFDQFFRVGSIHRFVPVPNI